MVSTNIFECSVAYRLGSEYPDFVGIAAQRVFMALILLADDYGNGRYIPANIRVRAFAATPQALDDITDDDIIEWIGIMEEEGAVRIYDIKGQKYYSLTGCDHYQRGNWRPKSSNIPKPPKEVLDTKRDKLPHKSEGTWRNEGKGKEENRKEEKGNKEYTPELVEFVDELFPKEEFAGWSDAQRLKQVDSLEKLTRIDKFPQDEVFAVLRWMRADNFWTGVFQSIPRLRDDGQKKYRNARGQWQQKTGHNDARKQHEDDSKFTKTGLVEL